MTQHVLPIDSMMIRTQQNDLTEVSTTLHHIEGKEISSDIVHDIQTGTVTVTFLNVISVDVAYKHNREK